MKKSKAKVPRPKPVYAPAPISITPGDACSPVTRTGPVKPAPVVFAMREIAIGNLRKAGWSEREISQIEETRTRPEITPNQLKIKKSDKRNARVSLDLLMLTYECEELWTRYDPDALAGCCIGMGMIAAVLHGKHAEFKLRSLGAFKTNGTKTIKSKEFMVKAGEIAIAMRRDGASPTKKDVWAATSTKFPHLHIHYNAYTGRFRQISGQ